MATMKYSRQREAIKSFLMTRKDHPTAETVYENVKKVYPNISLGTVYRNLTLLSEIGEIQKLHFLDGIDHFDADISSHNHFLCQSCGTVYDIDFQIAEDETMDAKADQVFSGKVTGHITYFQGECSNCLTKA